MTLAIERIGRAKISSFVKRLANHYVELGRELLIQLNYYENEDCNYCERPMNYTPQHIANFFLDRSDEENMPMTSLKLLKLVYIAYGWHLALQRERLFLEPIEAWKHGPVVPSLYHEFKHFRNQNIVGRSEDIDLDTWDLVTPRVPEDDEDTRFVLDKVWASYRRFAPWDLRNKTHETDGPWDRVYEPGKQNIELRDEDIQEHYENRIAKYIDAVRSSAS